MSVIMFGGESAQRLGERAEATSVASIFFFMFFDVKRIDIIDLSIKIINTGHEYQKYTVLMTTPYLEAKTV